MKPLTTVKAFLRNGDDILLLRRSPDDAHRPGQYDLPGGGMDPGEDVYATAEREIREETGLLIGREVMVLAYARTTAYPKTGANTTRIFMIARTASRDVRLSREHCAADWVPEAAVPTTTEYPPHQTASWHIGHYGLWQAYDQSMSSPLVES